MRHLALLWFQLRTSLVLAAQYRADFAVEGIVELFWTLTTLVPLWVVYGHRPTIAGWSFGEALLVTGFFTLLSGILEGAINPSMGLAVEQIRKGTLDFVLLKPKDTQLLVSTARILPWRALNILTAGAIFVYAFVRIGHGPGPGEVAVASVLLLASVTILYALWMLAISAAFHVVKVDNLRYLFGAVFDAARWPSSVFRGFLRIVFTFVIPLAVMTTFPAEGLLGRAGEGRGGAGRRGGRVRVLPRGLPAIAPPLHVGEQLTPR